ncbi:MAG: c-type cytochrome domain-containing protein, partial [Planctomycetaceae bacterium]
MMWPQGWRLGQAALAVCCAIWCLLWGTSAALADDSPAIVDFARQIRPILKARCVACHGPLKQSGGLRLDTAASLVRGGDTGPSIEAGNS